MSDLDGRVIAIAGVGGGLGPLVAARAGRPPAPPSPGPIAIRSCSTRSPASSAFRPSAGTAAPSTCSTRPRSASGARRWSSASAGSTASSTWSAAGAAGSRCTRRRSADWDLLHDLLIRTVQHTTRAFHAAAGGERARSLRPRLRQAGAGADQHQRRLRRRQGRRRGLDPRLRRRLRARRRHRQHRRRRGDPDAADAGGGPRQGLPHLHSRRAGRRGDRLPLLRRGGEDERPAAPAYERADEQAGEKARRRPTAR